jgi:hypothetical protein
MNKERRKQLDAAIAKIGEAKVIIDAMLQEEQETYDNLPEGLQGGEHGEAMETAIGALEQASQSCDEACEGCTEAMS